MTRKEIKRMVIWGGGDVSGSLRPALCSRMLGVHAPRDLTRFTLPRIRNCWPETALREPWRILDPAHRSDIIPPVVKAREKKNG